MLASRLARSERDTARRRMKALLSPPDAQHSDLAAIPSWAHALGRVALDQEVDLLQELLGDFAGGDMDGLSGLDGGGGGGRGDGGN